MRARRVRPDEGGVGAGWFLAAFVLLTVLGVVALVLVGFPGGPTEIVPTPQTLPATDDPATTTTSPPAGPATFPDGAAAPEGVSEVLVADGSTSLSFRVPGDLDPDDLRPAVAPVSAAPDGPSAISVRVGCAESVDEVLAQVSVSETDDAVSVLAVVLVPETDRPCDPGGADGAGAASDADRRTVRVPLVDPLGDRSISAVPQGTPVPDRLDGT